MASSGALDALNSRRSQLTSIRAETRRPLTATRLRAAVPSLCYLCHSFARSQGAHVAKLNAQTVVTSCAEELGMVAEANRWRHVGSCQRSWGLTVPVDIPSGFKGCAGLNGGGAFGNAAAQGSQLRYVRPGWSTAGICALGPGGLRREGRTNYEEQECIHS